MLLFKLSKGIRLPCVPLVLIAFACHAYPSEGREMVGLFLSKADQERISGFDRSDDPRTRKPIKDLMRRAKSAAKDFADPFRMDDFTQIGFGWCDSSDKSGTLSELTGKLDRESSKMRDLALAYVISGYKPYAVNAERYLLAWEDKGQLLNLYDLNIDFKSGSFDGMTEDGYCGHRPWNFALDTMWQTYGLINASDAYLLLKNGGHKFKDEARVRRWIRDLAEAVNSSFHAWTRWADHNESSRAYTRYRSDNHLSWCLAGLAAAGVSLGDRELVQYVINGGSWNDSKGGEYRNPSSIKSVIALAIEDEGETRGRIYEEKIRREPPVGYSFFHLWPMSLVAVISERHGIEDVWDYCPEDQAGLKEAYRRYAEYILELRESPNPKQERRRNSYSWLFEIASSQWPEERLFREARDLGDRNKNTSQSIGPVSLIFSTKQD
ncbi:alginate lyase family protein [Pelagicoccus sp. SDUM812002]|uniref:alginate lyase family protein n=1 Tax=Pelagicoccus sp. SDUM812002 TaxID=3041266 RepID=UPI00280D537B|nr:alginate lyase family protein [Pelagicoccus sp. SDUM812002]MDQ8185180.1 alginate lyase family protein [Pelagicoccus sp. SDUM812002]